MRSLTLALVAVLLLALKRAFELVLEREYATWAPALLVMLFCSVARGVWAIPEHCKLPAAPFNNWA